MNIAEVVAKWGHCRPSDTAFVEVRPISGARDQMSWAQFDERTNRLAHSLQDQGIQKGQKIFSWAGTLSGGSKPFSRF